MSRATSKIRGSYDEATLHEGSSTRATPDTRRAIGRSLSRLSDILQGEKFQTTWFYVTIWVMTAVFSYTRETSGNYLSVMKVELPSYVILIVKSFSYAFLLILVYLGDSVIGTYSMWTIFSILNITGPCLLQLLSCIPLIQNIRSVMITIRVICEFIYPITNVLLSILLTMGTKTSVAARNYEKANTIALFAVVFYYVGVLMMEIVDKLVFDYKTVDLFYFQVVNTCLAVFGAIVIAVVRSTALQNLRFQYKALNQVIGCTFAALINKVNPTKWHTGENGKWVKYAEKYTSKVQETTWMFHRMMVVALFAIWICAGYHFIREMSEKLSVYLAETYRIPLMKHARLISYVFTVVNTLLSYFIFIPFLFKTLKVEQTPFRIHGAGQFIMIVSLLMMYVFVMIIKFSGVDLHETTETQIRIFNGVEKTQLISKWANESIGQGMSKSAQLLVENAREHDVIHIENSFFNYTRTIFIYMAQSTSYVIAPNGLFRVLGHDPLTFNDIHSLSMKRSKLLITSVLKDKIDIHLWCEEGFHYSTKSPPLGYRSEIYIKPSNIYVATGKLNKIQLRSSFQILPKSIYTALVYKFNESAVVMELHLSFTTSKISEIWLFVPVYFSTVSLSFFYIAHLRIVTSLSPVSLIFTVYTISLFLTTAGSILYTPFIPMIGPTKILITLLFVNTAVLVFFVRFAMKFDTSNKFTE